MTNRELPAPEHGFRSDNRAPISPEAMAGIIEANHGHADSYGEDTWTCEAYEQLRRLIEHRGGAADDLRIMFSPTGTGANICTIGALLRSMGGCVLAAEDAHIRVDEAGAIERIWGTPIVGVRVEDGKISISTLRDRIHEILENGDHSPEPQVLSISQPTEHGRVYAPDELYELRSIADEAGMRIQIDGARLAYVLDPETFSTTIAIADALVFGGTKNGQGPIEAMITRSDATHRRLRTVAKQTGQTLSKNRYLAAGWARSLRSGEFERNAEHANAAAARLRTLLRDAGIEVHPGEANMVFFQLTPQTAEELRRRTPLSSTPDGVVRLVCSHDHTDEDLDRICALTLAVNEPA